MNTGTAKPVTLPVMENQLQLDHNHTTCHVYTNFSEFSPRASRRSHHPCLMIPVAWWKRTSTKPKSSMLFSSDRLPSRHSMENLHQSMQRLLQRTANYLCPSQFLFRCGACPTCAECSKTPGFDGIPTRLLVILKDEIVHCVHHIFTLSLTSGTLPTDWKSATVTPIYKERGNRQVATNYLPISLLSVLSKCLEKLVFKRLYSHLDQFLPIHQSGFRQRDSTAYPLARLVHRLATAGDEGNTTLACFYDLSKAFDRVWHKGLLAKLHHFGVRSHALAWITDYLSDRRQCVRLRNSTSSWLPVPAGVPQGSILGPLLFLAYTIDLPNCVRHPTQCDQFADDTALTTVSSSPGVCEEHIQQSVTASSTWLSNWRLTVNVEKTVTMAFTRRPFRSKVSINLNGNALSTVNEHRHLGLILSSDLR